MKISTRTQAPHSVLKVHAPCQANAVTQKTQKLKLGTGAVR